MSESFVDVLDGLATESKVQMQLKFLEIETSVNSELNQVFYALNQYRCRKEPVMEIGDGCIDKKGKDVFTQFLKTRNNQPFELQVFWERHFNVLPAFGFNSGKSDIHLTTS